MNIKQTTTMITLNHKHYNLLLSLMECKDNGVRIQMSVEIRYR